MEQEYIMHWRWNDHRIKQHQTNGEQESAMDWENGDPWGDTVKVKKKEEEEKLLVAYSSTVVEIRCLSF